MYNQGCQWRRAEETVSDVRSFAFANRVRRQVGAELRNGNERGSGSLVNRTLLAILIRLDQGCQWRRAEETVSDVRSFAFGLDLY
jgi:ribosomal protein L31E